MSDTFCLFDSGDALKINVDIYPAESSARRASAYLTVGRGPGFTQAAQRAAESVYRELKGLDSVKNGFSAGFDIFDTTADLSHVAGQSGGLAFALALAKKLLGAGGPPCAATGVIEANGTIRKVRQEDLEAKLLGACRVLPENSTIFYPDTNTLPPTVKAGLSARKIQAIQVSSVGQAVQLLPGRDTPSARPKKPAAMRIALVAFLLLLAGSAAIAWYVYQASSDAPPLNPPDVPKQVQTQPRVTQPDTVASPEKQPAEPLPEPPPVKKKAFSAPADDKAAAPPAIPRENKPLNKGFN